MSDYETIARKYCELQGLDPDEQTTIPCPDDKTDCLVIHYGPRWKKYVSVAEQHVLLTKATGLIG